MLRRLFSGGGDGAEVVEPAPIRAMLHSADSATRLHRHEMPIRRLANLVRTERLHAVLDACDAPLVLEKVRELGPERAPCLYRGSAEEEHAAIAPYLARVDLDLCEWIGRTQAHEPWGVFLLCRADLSSLRRHLRSLLTVRSPAGERLLFRFYDPRVLPPLLEVCTGAELDRLFGPVEAFAFPHPNIGSLTLLSRHPRPPALPPLRIPISLAASPE